MVSVESRPIVAVLPRADSAQRLPVDLILPVGLITNNDQRTLTDIIELAKTYGGHGYRRITALPARREGRDPCETLNACSGSFRVVEDFNSTMGGLGRNDGDGLRHGVTVMVPIILVG